MKMIIMFFLFSSCLSLVSIGQNLLPNGGFEEYDNCPETSGQIDQAQHWFNPTIGGENGSPDYFHSCTDFYAIDIPWNFYGYQQTFDGDAYAGIVLYTLLEDNAREYIEVELTDPLMAGEAYLLEMQINLANACRYTTDDIQVYFSDTAITDIPTYDVLPYEPHIENEEGNTIDTLSWTLFSGTYVALGGEAFLLVGNFKDDDETSTEVVNFGPSASYAYCYIDEVSLSQVLSVEEVSENEINVYPNPAHSSLQITMPDDRPAMLRIYDEQGRLIQASSIGSSTDLDIKGISNGVYFYQVMRDEQVLKQGKLVKQ